MVNDSITRVIEPAFREQVRQRQPRKESRMLMAPKVVEDNLLFGILQRTDFRGQSA
jgi:hypothetical protein